MFSFGSRAVGALALVVALTAAPLAACAPASPPEGGGEQSQSADVSDPTPSDGDTIVDPDQDTRRSGPAVSLGGPPVGGQGLEDVGGRWCEGVALFWGGAVPEGVSFTFEGITSDPGGVVLSGDQSPCGGTDPPLACIGLTMPYDAQTIFCSVALEPAADFADGTTVGFTGTLECTTKGDCDAVVAREVERGPAIVICDPATHGQGEACDPVDPTS